MDKRWNRIVRIVFCAVFSVLGSLAEAEAQTPVDGFNPGSNGTVLALAVQADGKIIVGGAFSALGGGTGTTSRQNLGRLHPDGSVDSTFDPGADGSINCIVIQPDGKILVGGAFTMLGGGGTGTTAHLNIGRLNPDGTIDPSFNATVGNIFGFANAVHAMALQGNGQIVVGGLFHNMGEGNAFGRRALGRLNSDGSVDPGFNPSFHFPNPSANPIVRALAIQADGKIIVGGEFTGLGVNSGAGANVRTNLGRLNPDGTVDPVFDPVTSAAVWAIAIQPDGKSIVGGDFQYLDNVVPVHYLGRLNRDGTVDSTFSLPAGAEWTVSTVVLQPDGRILIAGSFESVSFESRRKIARLHPNGTVDLSFNPGVDDGCTPIQCYHSNPVRAVAVQPDNMIVVGGSFVGLSGGSGAIPRLTLGRLHQDGSVDADFNPGSNGVIWALSSQPDGRVLVGGSFSMVGGGGQGTVLRNRLARLLPDGSVEVAFNPGANGNVFSTVVQPDGRILVAGAFTTLGGGGTGNASRSRIGRLLQDGSIDTGFDPGADGIVRSLVLQPDGKIILTGDFTMVGGGGTGNTPRNRIARLNEDGSLDTGFNPGANGSIFAVALQPNGRVLVGGQFTTIGGGGTGATPRSGLARLLADGAVDSSFSAAANAGVFAILVQSDDKIIVGGEFTSINDGTGAVLRWNVARLHPTGALDLTYNPLPDGLVASMSLRTNGQLLLSGGFLTFGDGSFRRGFGVVNSNGTIDPYFTGSGNGFGYAVIQADGKLVFHGGFSSLYDETNSVTPRSNLGRVTSAPAALQHLTVGGALDTVTWQRSGSSPEAVRVTFDLSVDGVVYTPLGEGVRAAGGWHFVANNLPRNQSLFVRGRASAVSSGHTNGSGSIHESIRNVYLSCPVVSPALTPGVAGSPFTESFVVTGATGVIAFSVNGQLPAGLTATSAGLTGIPTQAGLFPLTVTATDQVSGCTGSSQLVTLTIFPAVGSELVLNGSFASGSSGWTAFATPDNTYIQTSVVNGVLEFYRNAPPPNTSNQAVVLQPTGLPIQAGGALRAQFEIGNSSSVRKRVSVLLHDFTFADLSVCTFWLAPHTPMATYVMETHTTTAWTNLTISFYAATAASDGGFYQLDNISLQVVQGQSHEQTRCIDPTAPAPSQVSNSSDLLVNGTFAADLSGWDTFGQLNFALNGGVFEFHRPQAQPDPAGVILQRTGQAVAPGEILSAHFELGNSSTVRKRVTVLLHDLDFTDLSACTFWLEPDQPLSAYAMRSFATEAWTNATVSIYAATVGDEMSTRLDNISLRRTPSATVSGTDCLEPGSVPPPVPQMPSTQPHLQQQTYSAGDIELATVTQPAVRLSAPVVLDGREAKRQILGYLDVREPDTLVLRFWLRRDSDDGEIVVEYRIDGAWQPLVVVPPDDGEVDRWVLVELDLAQIPEGPVKIRIRTAGR